MAEVLVVTRLVKSKIIQVKQVIDHLQLVRDNRICSMVSSGRCLRVIAGQSYAIICLH
jgi:hypothetical protein